MRLAVLLSLCLACSGALEPGQVMLTVEPASLQPPGEPVDPVAVIRKGNIEIDGFVFTPTPCYEFTATASTHAAVTDVTLTAVPQLALCIQVIGVFRYQLTFPAVPANQTVRLTYQGTSGRDTSFVLQPTLP